MENIPAFPIQAEHLAFEPGMTLRDYFAAKIAQGAVAFPGPLPEDMSHDDQFAKRCYEIADAMMAARKK